MIIYSTHNHIAFMIEHNVLTAFEHHGASRGVKRELLQVHRTRQGGRDSKTHYGAVPLWKSALNIIYLPGDIHSRYLT